MTQTVLYTAALTPSTDLIIFQRLLNTSCPLADRVMHLHAHAHVEGAVMILGSAKSATKFFQALALAAFSEAFTRAFAERHFYFLLFLSQQTEESRRQNQ